MSDSKRKYQKKNVDYWSNLKKPVALLSDGENVWEPMTTSLASTAYSSPRSATNSSRGNSSSKIVGDLDCFDNLRKLKLPYLEKDGRISIRESIQLCQRVYANIAIFRNTIDVMTEFSCAPIYLTGGNRASKTFVENWLNKIGYEKLLQFIFREYYRSGNTFVFRYDGQFSNEEFKKFKTSFAAKKNLIPIRYTVLNPCDIVIYPAASFENAPYRKVLSQYEIQKLRDRLTEEDKALFAALPDDVKKTIDAGTWNSDGIYMPIPSEKLTAIFYKKQPYEPYAVPFGYPVLRDLDHKEELKKIDLAIAKTVDNIILLVTMGDKKDQYGNGINAKAMEKMQQLLTVESVGRVLVSDYSTKAEFIIPDIGEILNPQKYEVVNQDIKEGLLNVLSGEDKFANAVMKTQIFIERLKEGRVLVKDFLQKEINIMCQSLGFKSIPKVNFQETDLKDELQFSKLYTRLLEIGVLTPEQGIKAIKTGVLPEDEEIDEAQKQYVERRKDGLFNPLVGGVPPTEEGAVIGGANTSATGRPSGSSGTPKSSVSPSPQGTSKASLIEISKNKHLVSISKLKDTAIKISSLMSFAEDKTKKAYEINSLSEQQSSLIDKVVLSVVSNFEKEQWQEKVDSCLNNPQELLSYKASEVYYKVNNLAEEHNVDTYSAALLYHSKWQQ